ncbi:hypothetical protein MRB53_041588 [Persea americana]|nr:hypothetical protein MRB53_041588 [Persea americana]
MSQSIGSYHSYQYAFASSQRRHAQQYNNAVTTVSIDPFYELRQDNFHLPPVQTTNTAPDRSSQGQHNSSRPSRSIAIADLLSPDQPESEKAVASSSTQAIIDDRRRSSERRAEDARTICDRNPCTCHLSFRPRSQYSIEQTPSASEYSAVSADPRLSQSQVGAASQHSAVSSPVSRVSSLDISPQFLLSTTSPDTTLKYDLTFRQQPEAARACGHGDRDRRVVDPPPIVQLKIINSTDQTPMQDPGAVFAMYSYLVDAESGNEMIHPTPDQQISSNTGAMMGTLVVNPFQGKDEFGFAGTFFVFSDISCRFPGRYKLKFELLRINLQSPTLGTVHGTVATIYSDPFTTYPAKDFPGMQASTPLLRAFRRQGLNVGIKKGSEARKLQKGKARKRSESQESDRGFQPQPPPPGSSGQEYHAALQRKTEMGRQVKRARQSRIPLQ